MFINQITFENGVTVFLPAMNSSMAAESLKEKITNQKNVSIGRKSDSLRATMQSLQTLGASIIHKFLDSGDVYSIKANDGSLLHRFVREAND